MKQPERCPRCGERMTATVWPYLKGSLPGGEALQWWRCSACNKLFSRLTEIEERAKCTG